MTEQPSRRPKGSGGITEVARGKVYRVRVSLPADPFTGKRRQVERTEKGSRADAQRALTKLLADVQDGIAKVDPKKILVSEAFEDWLNEVEALGQRPMTIRTYRSIVTKHISPHFGALQLRELTAHHVSLYYRSRLDAGLAPGTVRLHHSVVTSACNQFVEWGWIPGNPAKGVKRPKRPEGSRKAPRPEQVREMIELTGDDHDLRIAVILAATTGARRGEVCGLRWSDVDWATGVVTIERARIPIGRGDSVGQTKSGKSRKVPVGLDVLAELKRYQAVQEARGTEFDIAPDWEGWLLSGDAGHTPWPVRHLSTAVTALGRKAGVDVTTHELRHFSATYMAELGVITCKDDDGWRLEPS